MQPIRIWREVGEEAEIELGDGAATPVANLPGPDGNARRDHLLRDAVRFEHFERRWMKRAGARIDRERRFLLDHDDGYSSARQAERDREPDRSGAGDKHAIGVW